MNFEIKNTTNIYTDLNIFCTAIRAVNNAAYYATDEIIKAATRIATDVNMQHEIVELVDEV